jgi:pyrroline-5-carboxylate reductase
MARIAIIGGGSIGEALLSGLLRAGRQVKDLVVVERVPERAKYLADTYSVLVTSSLVDAVENATFVVVAVKPADVESLMGQLARAAGAAEGDSAEQVFVNVAAGRRSYGRCPMRRPWWVRG